MATKRKQLNDQPLTKHKSYELEGIHSECMHIDTKENFPNFKDRDEYVESIKTVCKFNPVAIVELTEVLHTLETEGLFHWKQVACFLGQIQNKNICMKEDCLRRNCDILVGWFQNMRALSKKKQHAIRSKRKKRPEKNKIKTAILDTLHVLYKQFPDLSCCVEKLPYLKILDQRQSPSCTITSLLHLLYMNGYLNVDMLTPENYKSMVNDTFDEDYNFCHPKEERCQKDKIANRCSGMNLVDASYYLHKMLVNRQIFSQDQENVLISSAETKLDGKGEILFEPNQKAKSIEWLLENHIPFAGNHPYGEGALKNSPKNKQSKTHIIVMYNKNKYPVLFDNNKTLRQVLNYITKKPVPDDDLPNFRTAHHIVKINETFLSQNIQLGDYIYPYSAHAAMILGRNKSGQMLIMNSWGVGHNKAGFDVVEKADWEKGLLLEREALGVNEYVYTSEFKCPCSFH